ncbi:MAG: response regulator transcription factor [Elusimicrobiota bacterium]
MPARIIIVEDDPHALSLIRDSLSASGHACIYAGTCAEGWREIEAAKPDLVILDVGLPDGSGVELCAKIRSHPLLAPTPIIMLTALGGLDDKTSGFRAGADRYLVKPFQFAELKLWVDALLRRVKLDEREGGILRAEDFVVDPGRHTVATAGRIISDLTRKEFDLLYELVRHSPRVLSKEFILSALWHQVLRDNTVEVHIKNIRSKLGPSAKRVVTIPSVGYRFR